MKFRALRNWLTVRSLLGLLALGAGVLGAFPGPPAPKSARQSMGRYATRPARVIPDAKVTLRNAATKLDLLKIYNQ